MHILAGMFLLQMYVLPVPQSTQRGSSTTLDMRELVLTMNMFHGAQKLLITSSITEVKSASFFHIPHRFFFFFSLTNCLLNFAISMGCLLLYLRILGFREVVKWQW